MKHIDQSGKKFGRWTLIRRVPHNRRPHYLCKCDCGTIRDVSFRILLTGESKSCGCYRIDSMAKRNTKHGMYYTDIYAIWNGMNDRCCNPNSFGYSNYGGRGITVCDSWSRHNPLGFLNFYKDIGKRPSKKYSVDRINNNLGYSKDNCRWATSKEQGYNRRTSIIIKYKGIKMCVRQLSEILKVSHNSLLHRLNNYKFNVNKVIESYHKNPYKIKRHNCFKIEEIEQIKILHSHGISMNKLAKVYKVNVNTIFNAIKGKTYKSSNKKL